MKYGPLLLYRRGNGGTESFCPGSQLLCFSFPLLPLVATIKGHWDFLWAKTLRTFLNLQALWFLSDCSPFFEAIITTSAMLLYVASSFSPYVTLLIYMAGRSAIYTILPSPAHHRCSPISELHSWVHRMGHIPIRWSSFVPAMLVWGGYVISVGGKEAVRWEFPREFHLRSLGTEVRHCCRERSASPAWEKRMEMLRLFSVSVPCSVIVFLLHKRKLSFASASLVGFLFLFYNILLNLLQDIMCLLHCDPSRQWILWMPPLDESKGSHPGS